MFVRQKYTRPENIVEHKKWKFSQIYFLLKKDNVKVREYLQPYIILHIYEMSSKKQLS